MPTYLYECPKHGEFEEFHSITTDLKFCPHCEKEGKTDQEIKKLINGGGNGRGIVEVHGQDYINKLKKEAQEFKKEVYKNEQLYANVLGEARYEGLQRRIDANKRDGGFRRRK